MINCGLLWEFSSSKMKGPRYLFDISRNSLRTMFIKTRVHCSLCTVHSKFFRSCYHTVPSAIWEIFSEFVIFCNLFHKTLGEWNNSKILHEALCDNYFIIKCLLKYNVSRIILLTNCVGLAWYNLMLYWYT